MEQFKEIKLLGQGGFGSAKLVKRKNDNELFVIKVVKISAMSETDRLQVHCSILVT